MPTRLKLFPKIEEKEYSQTHQVSTTSYQIWIRTLQVKETTVNISEKYICKNSQQYINKLNSCVCANGKSLGFSTYKIMWCVHRDSFTTFFPIQMSLFLFLACLLWLGVSNTMLNRCGKKALLSYSRC